MVFHEFTPPGRFELNRVAKSEQAGKSATTSSRLFLSRLPFCCRSLSKSPLTSAIQTIIKTTPFFGCLRHTAVMLQPLCYPPLNHRWREAFSCQCGSNVPADKISWVHFFHLSAIIFFQYQESRYATSKPWRIFISRNHERCSHSCHRRGFIFRGKQQMESVAITGAFGSSPFGIC